MTETGPSSLLLQILPLLDVLELPIDQSAPAFKFPGDVFSNPDFSLRLSGRGAGRTGLHRVFS